MTADDLRHVYHYHDETKHHFNRFARALGYLDWAAQPRPFRSFEGATSLELFDRSGEQAGVSDPVDAAGARRGGDGEFASYDRLLSGPSIDAWPIARHSIGELLRYALGLSAWKVFHESRWSLRVNPSSGNLHPTEAYLIAGALPDLESNASESGSAGTVWHYAPDRHVIERRCGYAADAWHALDIGAPTDAFLVALTSIHWREAWKYGERAFRYCQHDLGHAVAALRLSAALLGWRAAILPSWSHRAIATIAGLDRDEDYIDAEREEPGCLLLVSAAAPVRQPVEAETFTAAVRGGQWSGQASQLSEDHVQWTFIDEVARATLDLGTRGCGLGAGNAGGLGPGSEGAGPGSAGVIGRSFEASVERAAAVATAAVVSDRRLDARALILQRRSALALDGLSSIGRAAFLRILERLMPHHAAPWDALWWAPCIHLALFVHRVDGLAPGLYLLPRSPAAEPALRAAL
jgi:SagB-type dehydrogenase family enzyme